MNLHTIMATYTESQYLELYPDPVDQLEKVQAILAALYDLELDLISKGGIKSYLLDDGQIRISREYSTLGELKTSRLYYEQLGNRLLAQLYGRQTKILPCLG